MSKKKTNRPTGLTLTRSGSKFSASWKKGENRTMEKTELWYELDRAGKEKWNKSVKPGANSTSASFDLGSSWKSSWYPVTGTVLTAVVFAVRNKAKAYKYKDKKKKEHTAKPAMSAWSALCHFGIVAPAAPSASVSVSGNLVSFSWAAADDNTGGRPFTRVEYKEALLYNDAAPNWGLIRAMTSSSASGSTAQHNDKDLSGNYVRWFAVRALGPGGSSAWTIIHRSFGNPYSPKLISGRAWKTGSGATIQANVQQPASRSHRCDSVTLQYSITAPSLSGGSIVAKDASWTDLKSATANTESNYTASFGGNIDQYPGDDACLFLRAVADHDGNKAYSSQLYVMPGAIKAPAISSVTQSGDALTITISHATDLEDATTVVTVGTNTGKSQYLTFSHSETEKTVTVDGLSSAEAFTVTAKEQLGALSSGEATYSGSSVERPSDVSASVSGSSVTVSWINKWESMTGTELSYADHADAWESTDDPETYTISGNATRWNIAGLKLGTTYYIRLRSIGENDVMSPWTDPVAVNLSSAPVTPEVTASDSVITADGEVVMSWAFECEDGTAEAYAEIAQCTRSDDGTWTYTPWRTVASALSATIAGEDLPAGEVTCLAVRLTSAAGRQSGWSKPVSVYVAQAPSCSIASVSTEAYTYTDDTGAETTVQAIRSMPLTVFVAGANAGTTVTLTITRSADYHVERPDESEQDGYADEVIAFKQAAGTGETSGDSTGTTVTISTDDLTGRLDDTAEYMITATVHDSYLTSDPAKVTFPVHWSHQAGTPGGAAESDSSALIVRITPTAPEGAADTDVCDIYRLSLDRPQLIIQGGSFGVTYVDPYPAFGDYGGHRIVTRTATGDYITEDSALAMLDLAAGDGDYLDHPTTVIDWGEDSVDLPFNLELSNSWDKDFQQTRYLGGSTVGDWNPGITRSLSVSTDVVIDRDDTAEQMRRLATYSGICNIRTPDGSSFHADVQVQEKRSYSGKGVAEFSLTVSQVDGEALDGMTLAEWNALQEEST